MLEASQTSLPGPEGGTAVERARGERLYATLLESLDGIIWEAEAGTFKFTFVSPQSERILGYTAEEWLNDPHFWIRHLHPEDREWCPDACVEAAQSGSDHELEYRMIAADGRVVWLRDVVTVRREPDGQTCLSGIMLDVTESKRVEAALRESEERFRFIFERSPAGMLIRNLPGFIVQANQAFCDFIGRSENELKKLTIPELVPVEDRQGVLDRMAVGGTIDDVRRYVRADGEILWGRTTAFLLQLEGSPAYWIAVIQDVTAQKRAEEVLRLSEKRFRIVANDTPAYLWLTSSDTHNSFINKQLAAFLGTEDTSLGENWIDCVHPDDRPGMFEAFQNAFPQGLPISVECRVRRYDGEYRWVIDQALPRRSPDGEFLGHAGSLTDITEAKVAQEGLRAAHDALANELTERRRAERQVLALTDRLISAQEEERSRIARELHDNLSQQIAAVSIMLSSLKGQIPERNSALREQADRAHHRLSQVAEGIRNISHDLHPAILEHAGLTAALRAHCSEFTALTGMEIQFQADEAFTNLRGDVSICIYRVAQEALQNVMKHAGTKAAHVSLVRRERSICLTITDRGAGFDPTETSALSGLGLVSMRERVKLVHGNLELTSKPLEGTTLRACIPVD
ncbi:MAG: PAS domain S-box protein [Acidobacteriota bacterium]|nr:PAS domain S-box protein [Acidobacteriota bacterium]